MKAIVQSYKGGEPEVKELPPPALQQGGVLVRNAVSLVSAGTERGMVELAQKSLLGKARQRPDLVRKVLDKVRRDGVLTTVETVRSRLDAPVPLGYSCAGTVVEVAEGAGELRPGDRVACAGAGYANHAEVIFVPRNLAVKIPDEVDFEAASFTTVGAIALQGLRLARPELGETVVVIGLGLVGLLAAQLARAAGCKVLGMDTDTERCRFAESLGLDAATHEEAALEDHCRRLTAGHGADRVIIAASTTSSRPVSLAGEIARDRGAVVVVGAVGMEVPRQPFYDKELSLQVSRSYGPGRYDPEYEEKGRDYPIGHARWTENRNLQAFVDQLAAGRLDTAPLVSHRFAIAEAPRAYSLLTEGQEPYLGILLTYPRPESEEPAPPTSRVELTTSSPVATGAATDTDTDTDTDGIVRLGSLGAGLFASGVLLPTAASLDGVELAGVCTATGTKAEHMGRKLGFRFATTREEEVLEDSATDAVLIATRHHLHGRQVLAAHQAGKHVFVEKPLCLSLEELAEIEALYGDHRRAGDPLLMVGFNRRFAPMARKLGEFVDEIREPLVMHYRVNAGYIPADHWVHDPEQGGGRILGEVCHFVDFLIYLAGETPAEVDAWALPDSGRYRSDNLVAMVRFPGGSLGTITYVAHGDSGLPKERLEVTGGGAAAVLDNFRTLELLRGGKRETLRARLRQDKGHRGELEAFVDAIRDGTHEPIPYDQQLAATHATFEIAAAIRRRNP